MRNLESGAFSVAGVPLIQFFIKALRKINFPHALLKTVPQNLIREISGGDALRGNTRPHPEHDG